VPLVPWFFWTGTKAAVGSIALGAAAAIAVGGMLGYLGGRNVAWSATRQLLALPSRPPHLGARVGCSNVTVT